MFKVNNKNTFFSVSIVELEQVNVSCVAYCDSLTLRD